LLLMPTQTVSLPRLPHEESRQGQHPDGLELISPRGEARGYVDPLQVDGHYQLEDLWVMQGSICDLKCTHCYTASSPTNNRLEQIRFEELQPHLDDAARFGVEKICYTGGEVFVNEAVLRRQAEVNEEFVASLAYALEIAPVEILTNARRYIRNHFDVLRRLRQRHGDRLRLRVTLESPRAEEHDRIRGQGTFAQTVETIHQLQELGFTPILTAERPFLTEKTDEEIRAHYQALFRGPVEVNLIVNVLEMGHQLVQLGRQGQKPRAETFITTNCFSLLNKPAESLMCHYSRCLQKIEGRLRYYPCPVIYDDARFELGTTLEESFSRVYVAHKNCYDYCMKGGGATCRTRLL
jgi:sulfatase maturation enzyme AslB (radical SAM superfamily)